MKKLKITEQVIEQANLILPIEQAELEEMIEQASRVDRLNIVYDGLTKLPESVKYLTVTSLVMSNCQLTGLPESIGRLSNLKELHLANNRLTSLPESIGNLSNLTKLYLRDNQLISLPECIGNLSKLAELYLGNNKLKILPESAVDLSSLESLDLSRNFIADFSILQRIRKLGKSGKLKNVYLLEGVKLSHRYWTKISAWKAKWLLDEDNAEVRRALIEHFGYEKIYEELKVINLDAWREYTLVEIKNMEEIYDNDGYPMGFKDSLFLLKMICPSTQHIHILRVPPEMTSAEAAITWVNHGIHPDEFAMQT